MHFDNLAEAFAIVIFCAASVFLIIVAFMHLLPITSAHAKPESCECLELRRIRTLLEHQSGVTCNLYRCLPAPTPTVPDGGPLE